MVKRKLFILLRTLKKDNWTAYLQQVVSNLNSLPNIAIGGLKPVNIKSSFDDPKIDAAKLAQFGTEKEVHFKDWEKNQQIYEKSNSELKEGSYVYVGFSKDPMYKLKDFQVSFKNIFC
jgi:hypothetical protein